MSNEKRNLKNSINKAMKTPANTTEDTKEQSYTENNQYYETEMDSSFKENYRAAQDSKDEDEKSRIKLIEKPLKMFGALCLAIGIVSLFFTGTSTVDTSQSAKNALKDRVSTAISAGTVLLSADENAEAKDYTITHQSKVENTKIWVWDYAAEDGDYVQVIINGTPAGDAFMIKHKPKEITVPAVGTVQIKGIRDGGGGITYAVRYDINGTSYFNGTPEGKFNTYTLMKE